MSFVDLRVELPAHAQSFSVQVQTHWSVREIKEEIQRACPGSPQVHGQRIIWRGRILRDEEKAQDVWKSPDDARIVHLAVHPSAWTSIPTAPTQTIPAPPTLSPPILQSRQPQRRDSQTGAQYQVPSPIMPLPYILRKHNAALDVLTKGTLPSETQPEDMSQLRTQAVTALQAWGYSWPAVLDEEYPRPEPSNNGVKYERIVVDNQPFLRLETPNATPTPMQRHALKVLSHTFSLLSVPAYESTPYTMFPPYHPMSYGPTPTTNLNQHLQQIGIPPLRLAPTPNQPNANDPNNAVVAEIRAIPLRALLMPLMMLTFRTFLLVYFFSPSKRPLFGILLSVWILYETWGALRGVLGNDRQPAGQGGGQARADAGANGDQAANPQRAQGQGGIGAVNSQSTNRTHSDVLLDHLANMDLSSEDTVIDSALPASPPSVARKVKSFVVLMVTTLHPAVWDRRRVTLRKREGRLRTEANVRESEPPAEGSTEDPERANARAQVIARHQRRPQWIRDYIDRVQNTEWADDM